MKTQMKRLRGRRGFTLVECIIAIAVFAAMTMLVFMILTHARNSAVTANKAEEDLTGMISNVVGDDSYKKFYKDSSESLVLQVDNDSSKLFSVSYNKVNGFKNYMVCDHTGSPLAPEDRPTTPYMANNTEFMFNAADGKPIAKAEDFDPSTCIYKCPECDATLNPELRCDDCGEVGKADTTGNILYDDIRKIYYCKICGGTTVMSWDSTKNEYISERAEKAAVESNASLQISGLYANAIKYGRVYTPDDPKTLFKTAETGGAAKSGGQVSATLSYKSNSNHSTPGLYTLSVNNIVWPTELSGSNRELQIFFPPYYNFTDVKFNDSSIVSEIPDYSKDQSKVNAAYGRMVRIINPPSSFIMYFRLENYESGFAFEYDYNKSGKQLTNLSKEVKVNGIVETQEIPDYPDTEKTQGLFAWFGLSIQPSQWNNRTPNDPNGYINDVNGVSISILNTQE